MTILQNHWLRIRTHRSVEVNSNGRWPSGRDDLQFYAMMILMVGAGWIYSLQLIRMD